MGLNLEKVNSLIEYLPLMTYAYIFLAGGQLVSHVASAGVVTTAGLVASQVLINQGGIISQVLHIPGQALPAGHVILTLPTSQTLKTKTSSVDGDEEEEPIDRSRSPSPLLPTFAGPVVRFVPTKVWFVNAVKQACFWIMEVAIYLYIF